MYAALAYDAIYVLAKGLHEVIYTKNQSKHNGQLIVNEIKKMTYESKFLYVTSRIVGCN